MSKFAAVVLTAALVLAPAGAGAACKLKDLKGNWVAYSTGIDADSANWSTCYLRINGKGKITKSSCGDSDGTEPKLTNGSFKMPDRKLCSYTASFNFEGVKNVVEHGTLAEDKATGNGVGTFPGGIFIFSLTKVAAFP